MQLQFAKLGGGNAIASTKITYQHELQRILQPVLLTHWVILYYWPLVRELSAQPKLNQRLCKCIFATDSLYCTKALHMLVSFQDPSTNINMLSLIIQFGD